MQKIWAPDDGYADIAVGLQFGDEAKARFVDQLAELYDLIARYNGGPNAGHTICVQGKKVLLRQIPSAVEYPRKQLMIAAGCVVNVGKLETEMNELSQAGIEVQSRLRLSGFASVIQPHHIVRDLVTMQSIGTTGNGIGPCYADQAARMEYDRVLDIRLNNLVENFDYWFDMIKRNLDAEMQKLNVTPDDVKRLSGTKKIDIYKELEDLRRGFERLKDNIELDPFYLMEQIRKGMKILLEGAQSIGLDNTYGTHPFTTGSKITPAAAAHSAGIDPDYLRNKFGIIKGIPSRVGFGPFAGEFGGNRSEAYWSEGNGHAHTAEEEWEKYGDDGSIKKLDEMLRSPDDFEVGIALRMLGGEYGASKRPRRVGMLDLVYLRSLVKALGINGLFMSKADQWVHFARTDKGVIRFVDQYRLDGKLVDAAILSQEALRRVEIVERTYDPFEHDITHVRTRDELPPTVQRILTDIQENVGVNIMGVGVGKNREEYVPLVSA